MRLFIAALLIMAAVILYLPLTGYAWDQPQPPQKHHHHHHDKPTPTPTPTPVPPVQENRQAFCVTSVEGKTYLDLTVGAMNPGTVWRAHYDNGDTVVVGGRSIKLVNTGPSGITLAVNNGSTC